MCVMSVWKEIERPVCEHALFWRVSQRNEKTDKVLYVEQTVAEKSNIIIIIIIIIIIASQRSDMVSGEQ